MLKQILLGSVMATAIATGANALLIDDFNEAPQAISIDGPLALADPDISVTLLDNAPGGGAFGSIIGGYRDLTTTLVVSPAAGRKTNSDAAIVGGEFSHSQDLGVRSNSVITWDGLGGAGLASADLTAIGGVSGLASRFHVVVTAADLGIRWSLELFDGNSSGIVSFDSPGLIGTATSFFVSFSEAAWSTIDFTDINKIIFSANTLNTVNVDTGVCLVQTVGLSDPGVDCSAVPEPASLSLIGAGLMGLAYFGKRRRKAA